MKQLASQLREWDRRIVEIAALQGSESTDLICRFNPEPDSDSVGFFWIVNLMARMEMEGIDPSFDLGFTLGDRIFLPNGKIADTREEQVILWPNNEDQ